MFEWISVCNVEQFWFLRMFSFVTLENEKEKHQKIIRFRINENQSFDDVRSKSQLRVDKFDSAPVISWLPRHVYSMQ